MSKDKEIVKELISYFNENCVEGYDSCCVDSWEFLIANGCWEYGDDFSDFKYSIKKEDETGGYEGDGEYTHKVFSFTDKETNEKFYIRFEGCYDSWNGTTWYSHRLVEPYEKTIIAWKTV